VISNSISRGIVEHMSAAGYLLRTARRRAHLSQRALAERAGVPQSHIARIESGQADPRVSTLRRLLRECDHSLEALPGSGRGVDLTRSGELLALTPAERLRSAGADAAGLSALDRARRS